MESRATEQSVHLRHPFGYLYPLRALGFAGPAGGAGAGAGFVVKETEINHFERVGILIDHAVIIKFEIPGDIHAVRAGHAVTAFGAGDDRAIEEGRFHFGDQFFILRGE